MLALVLAAPVAAQVEASTVTQQGHGVYMCVSRETLQGYSGYVQKITILPVKTTSAQTLRLSHGAKMTTPGEK